MANPTIGATTPRIQYTATASQTVFTVPFEFLANADLAVYVNGTLKTLTTDYTLTGANTTGGGSLTFVTGRTAGEIVTILGNLAYSRDTNKYTKYGLLPAEVLEADFDATQVQVKQLARDGQFALRVPLTDTGTPDMVLPAKATRATKALGFDSDGDPVMSASSLADIDATVQIIDTLNALPAGASSSISYQPAGTGAVATTVQAKLRETVSVKDFGATGDGTTDDTAALEASSAASHAVQIPGSGTYKTTSSPNGWEVPTDTTVIGNGQAILEATTVNYRPLNVDAETTLPANVNLINLVLKGNTGSSDDWAPIRLASKHALMLGNYTAQANYGMTMTYSYYNDKTERRTTELRAVGNLSQGNGTGFEIFSTKNSAYVGNVAYKDGSKASAHGFRYTGYGVAQPAPGTDLKTYGNASAGNTANNYANGVSFQTGNYANAHVGYSLTNCTNGIQFNTVTSSASDVSKNNVFSGVAIDSVTTGIVHEKSEKTVCDAFSISNFTYRGISSMFASSTSTYGTGKYNRVSALVSDYTGTDDAVRIETSNGRWDLTVADIGSTYGRGVRVTGSWNVITLVGGGGNSTTSPFLGIEGSNNIVIFAGNNIAQMFSEVSVSGSNNLIIAMLDTADTGGEFTVSGTGNQFIGNFGFLSIPGATNRIDGVMNCKAQGTVSATTDASGDVTVTLPYTLLSSTYAAVLSQSTASGGTPYFLQAHTKTTSSFKVRAYTTAGAAAATTAIAFGYNATVTA
jgi:hypothetical protein